MFESVSKLRLLRYNRGLPAFSLRVETNGGETRDESNVNGGMRDKKLFGRGRISSFCGPTGCGIVLKLMAAGASDGLYSENCSSNQAESR